MAVSSAVKIATGGKEKDFFRLWNSGMAKAALGAAGIAGRFFHHRPTSLLPSPARYVDHINVTECIVYMFRAMTL